MSALTLGPLLFNWKPERRRDFYARVADEAPVDCVYLGEVVCSKREPFFVDDLPAIAERLVAAGKQVVYSTLALVTTDREMEEIRALCGEKTMIEANDVASINLLAGAPFVSGPFINTFNEATIDFLVARGAVQDRAAGRAVGGGDRDAGAPQPGRDRGAGLRPSGSVAVDALLSRARLRAAQGLLPVRLRTRSRRTRRRPARRQAAAGRQRHPDPVARLCGGVRRSRAAAGGRRQPFPAVAADDRHGQGREPVPRRARRPHRPGRGAGGTRRADRADAARSTATCAAAPA